MKPWTPEWIRQCPTSELIMRLVAGGVIVEESIPNDGVRHSITFTMGSKYELDLRALIAAEIDRRLKP